MTVRIRSALCLVFLLFWPFTAFAEKETLIVATAANLASTIPHINGVFEKNYPGVKIQAVIGSSGALTAQILNGAPYDVFLSADMNYPEQIYFQGEAAGPPELYALGKLVLVSRIDYSSFSAEESILKSAGPVVIPNPQVAPYGKAALEYLHAAVLYDLVEPRTAYTQNIPQTVRMILATDGIGFISKSAMLSLLEKEKESSPYTWFEIDSSQYSPIRQGSIITNQGKNNIWARTYLNFLITGEGRVLLHSHGYTSPPL